MTNEEQNQILQQPLVGSVLHPDIENLIRYTIKQWCSLNELLEPDYEDLVNCWLNGDLREWLKKHSI